MKKMKTPKVPRWISDPLVETQAARRIKATTKRHTPEARQRAAAYQREYRQRPEVRVKKLAQHRAWRARLKIKFLAGDNYCHLPPRRRPEYREGNPGQPRLDF